MKCLKSSRLVKVCSSARVIDAKSRIDIDSTHNVSRAVFIQCNIKNEISHCLRVR